jgi:hypothetical protein
VATTKDMGITGADAHDLLPSRLGAPCDATRSWTPSDALAQVATTASDLIMCYTMLAPAIRLAQLLGLHRLGSDPNKMPPDDPAFAFPGRLAIKREVALRIWSYLRTYGAQSTWRVIRDPTDEMRRHPLVLLRRHRHAQPRIVCARSHTSVPS